ncbi:MAG: SCO family protein [Gammaproteobacteria bacterium]|nr:SCO family protein [Gammaproteobacteria bacterium]
MNRLLLILLMATLIPGQTVFAEGEALERSGINTRYMLIDHFGELITDANFSGSYQLIAFGYTHCPDVCPTSLAAISAALDILEDDGDRIQPLFVTVDPERDTPQRLREYLDWFNPRIIGLSGSTNMIASIAKNYKVEYEKTVNEGDDPKDYWMDHTASLYFLGPNGKFLVKFAYGISASDLAAKIREYM